MLTSCIFQDRKLAINTVYLKRRKRSSTEKNNHATNPSEFPQCWLQNQDYFSKKEATTSAKPHTENKYSIKFNFTLKEATLTWKKPHSFKSEENGKTRLPPGLIFNKWKSSAHIITISQCKYRKCGQGKQPPPLYRRAQLSQSLTFLPPDFSNNSPITGWAGKWYAWEHRCCPRSTKRGSSVFLHPCQGFDKGHASLLIPITTPVWSEFLVHWSKAFYKAPGISYCPVCPFKRPMLLSEVFLSHWFLILIRRENWACWSLERVSVV